MSPHRLVLASLALLGAACTDVGLEAFNDSGVIADTGSVGERLEVVPQNGLDFGRVDTQGNSVAEEVVITNTSSGKLPIIDIYMDEFTSQAYWLPDELPLPILLNPGGAFTVDVYFKPYAVGEFTGTVVVEVDDKGELLTVERDLKGLGCDSTASSSSGGC